MPVFWRDSFELESGPEEGGGTRRAIGHDDEDNGSGPFDRNGDGVIDPNDPLELGPGGDDNFFVRTNSGRADGNSGRPDLGFDRDYVGRDGDWYWYSEDVFDSLGDGNGVPDLGVILWEGIDISGLTNISFNGLFAGRDTGLTVEVGDFIRVQYSIDGGAFVTGLQFVGNGVSSDGWLLDDNLDGVITAADSGTRLDLGFADFGFNVAGTGTTLVLRIEVLDHGPASSSGASEEFAFDNFELSHEDLNAPQRVNFFQDDFEMSGMVEIGGIARSAIAHADTLNGTGPFDANGDGVIDMNDPAEFNPSLEDNFFVRTDSGRDTSIGFDREFTGRSGDFVWVSEDVQDATNVNDQSADRNNDLGILEWADLDITGLVDISFAGLFGARQNVTIEEGDRLAVEYSIDGGAFVTGLQFLGTGATEAGWFLDANLDGVIDGTETINLNTALSEFTFDIAATGSSLTLRYVNQDFLASNSGASEEVAIDNFRLSSAVAGGELDGSEFRDVFDGGTADDVLNGNGGNDVLRGANGDDTLNGGANNDALNGGRGADILDGGTGFDSAVYIMAGTGVTVNLTDSSLNTGEAAGDTYISIERVDGSRFADDITGNAEDNFLAGRGGNDVINGGLGADRILGDNGDDDLFGEAGNDYITGGLGEDYLSGSTGNDRLFGNNGADELEGGAGNDTLIGGGAADSFLYLDTSNLGSRDFILDFQNGFDQIVFDSTLISFADLKFVQVGDNAVIGTSGIMGQILLVDVNISTLDESDFAFIAPAVGANDLGDLLADVKSSPVADALSDSGDSYAADYDVYDFA